MFEQSKQIVKKGLSWLYALSVLWSRNLRFGQKSFILALIVFVSVATLSLFLYQRIEERIYTAQQELNGIALFPGLIQFTRLVQQHRGAAAGVLGGTQQLDAQRKALQQQLSVIYQQLQQNLPDHVLQEQYWKRVRLLWTSIVGQGMNWSVKTNFEVHTQLINAVYLLLNDIAEQYLLINTYSVSSQYLVNTIINQLLPTLENLGQIRASGTAILAKQHLQSQEKEALAVLLAVSQRSVDTLHTNLIKTGTYNPELYASMLKVSQASQRNINTISSLLDTNIFNEKYEIEADVFFNYLTRIIDNNYQILEKQLLPTLKQLIEEQLSHEKQIFFTSSIVLIVMILLLLYICFGIYLSTKENMETLLAATAAFSKGDLQYRIRIDCRNEFAAVYQSFNAMATRIVRLIEGEKKAAARIQAIFNALLDASIQMDAEGRVIGWNKNAEQIFGWSEQEVTGRYLHDYIIPERYRQQHQQGLAHFLATGEGPILNRLVEIEALHAKGHELPIELTIAAIEVEGSYEFTAFVRDISQRKKTEEALQLFARIFNDTHEGIMITDPEGRITDVNPAFSEITGYRRDEVLGQNPSLFKSGKHEADFYRTMWQQLIHHGHWQGEIWNRNKEGELYAELLTISALKDEQGVVIHYIGIFTDITQNKWQQEQLSQMAYYDVLTGLANRVLFADRFAQAVAHSHRAGCQLAVCFIDLDNFKPVNDNFGHDAGDQLLIEVARRMTAMIREEDTAARMGGDEFALLLNEIESRQAIEATLKRILSALSQPYVIDGHRHQITASCGVTLYPDDRADVDTLLRHADQAMYQAKISGKHRYHIFNPDQDQQKMEAYSFQDEIAQALQQNEFSLYLQPKVNMRKGTILGAEALIRWHHPAKGLVPPMRFLPAVEGTELEITIGNWVIDNALALLAQWHRQGLKLQISINISTYHLLSEHFVRHLEALLDNYSEVDSRYLQLEILESSVLADLDAMSEVIRTCRQALGLSVALDDFGTGYSSLTHLKHLPVDTVKIDRSFVSELLEDADDYTIVEGVIGLARAFNCSVIAEGVETAEQGLMLLLMGCDDGQGYGIARPMSAEDFLVWCQHYRAEDIWQQYSRQSLTRAGKEVYLFRLKMTQWHQMFLQAYHAVPAAGASWPVMQRRRCACGQWFIRAKHEDLFEESRLQQLEQLHHDYHLIAGDVYQACQEGNSYTAQAQVTALKTAFENIISALQAMA